MKMRHRSALLAFLALVTASGIARAQQRGAPGEDAQKRAMLEQRLRERTGNLVKQRLQLTDDQMRRLQAANSQFEKQRTALFTQEREVRREMRQQILAGDRANQNRVAQLLNQMMQLERQRLDLTQSEQAELSKFLTPVQRAKLLAVQTGLRRREQELRGGAMRRQGDARMRPSKRMN